MDHLLSGKTIQSVVRPDGDYLDTGMPHRLVLIFDDGTRLHLNPHTDVNEDNHIELALEGSDGKLTF